MQGIIHSRLRGYFAREAYARNGHYGAILDTHVCIHMLVFQV